MVLLAVAISMSMAACSLFDGSPVREKVVQHPAAKNADPYMIGSDDELEIIVWTQPQLSGKVTVASDGTISMPLIGRVPAAGMTPDQLKADLEKRYARYVHGGECYRPRERSGQPRFLRARRGEQARGIQASLG